MNFLQIKQVSAFKYVLKTIFLVLLIYLDWASNYGKCRGYGANIPKTMWTASVHRGLIPKKSRGTHQPINDTAPADPSIQS
jgi:hypothetical protein